MVIAFKKDLYQIDVLHYQPSILGIATVDLRSVLNFQVFTGGEGECGQPLG